MSELKESRAAREAAELAAAKEAARKRQEEAAFLNRPSFTAPLPDPMPAPPAPEAAESLDSAPDVPAQPEATEKPVAARKTAAPKKKGPMPWDGIPDYPVAKFSMLFSTVLDAKMVWIGQNVPGGMSKQQMVKQALSEWVEHKLTELQK
jgi:hypothetical protein